mmetsp:Transcript_41810/g.89101  ORF Transcript_41810/g.89101 Transcript_41810/m.89101 type:complete len:1075 (-) Transcript_41810:69-3293(-)
MVVTTPRSGSRSARPGYKEEPCSTQTSTAASSLVDEGKQAYGEKPWSNSSSKSNSALPPLGTMRPATTGCEGTAEAPNTGAARLPVLDFAGKDNQNAPPAGGTALFCPQCGSRLVPGGRFCADCGLSLTAAAQLLLTSARAAQSPTARGGGGGLAGGSKQRGAEASRMRPRPAPLSARGAATASGAMFPHSTRSQPAQAKTPQTARGPSSPLSARSASPLGGGPSAAITAAQEEAREALPQDQSLQGVVQRMTQALLAYYQKRGVHCGIAGNWTRFFKDVDSDGSGKITLEELDAAVRNRLKASVSRYELRVLFQRVDTNGSGLATMQEFAKLLYRTDLATWPDISGPDLERILRKLLSAAQRWHNAGGNWFKIFKAVDAEGSGYIAYDELVKYVRAATGLQLRAEHMADKDLLGFWKALDATGKMDVSVHQFMSFMRRCTSGVAIDGVHSLHKLTSYAKAKRGLDDGGRDIAAEIAKAPNLDEAALTSVSKRLAVALGAWLAKRGIAQATFSTTSPKVWSKLFDFADADHSGRISFVELEDATRNQLRVGSKTVSDDELKALWRMIDADGSGESTTAEFGRCVYRLQLAEWPSLEAASLERIVLVMNSSADRWHRCGGNWYKVFAMVENSARHSGELEYDEMVRFLREPYPRLQLTRKDIGDEEMRGLWKALDTDESGKVTVKEFTAFMRLHGRAIAMHKLTEYSKQKRGLADTMADLGPVPERTRDQLRASARALDRALQSYFTKQGIYGNTSTKFDWGRIFNEADGNSNGRLTFAELETVLIRRLAQSLGHHSTPEALLPEVSREDMRALWALVDTDCSGEATAKEWTLCLYALEVETWPDDDDAVQEAVKEMSEAAARWHRAGGNWYKVFNLIDGDNTGSMGFDELKEVVYRPLPCLAIPATRVSEHQLKAMWKALDENMSSLASVREFMVFMRRRGAKSGINFHRSVSRTGKSSRAESRSRLSGPGFRTTEEAEILGRALAAQTPKAFEDAYKSWGVPWQGQVSEWDLLSVVRRLLGLTEQRLSDDAVHAAWRALDRDGVGKVSVEAVLEWGRELVQEAEQAKEDGDDG